MLRIKIKIGLYRIKWAIECLVRTPEELREMAHEFDAVFDGRM